MKRNMGTDHNRIVRRGPILSGVGWGTIKDTTDLSHKHYGQNFIGFNIQLTRVSIAGLNKKSEVRISLSFFLLLASRGGYAMKTSSFDIKAETTIYFVV